MKEFYGEISFSGCAGFSIDAETSELAEDIVFTDIEGIELNLKDGSKLTITEINWDLIEEASRGNITPPFVHDFWIEEER
ncbi:hypothetical protein CF065_18835 [Clostridium sporogenes]